VSRRGSKSFRKRVQQPRTDALQRCWDEGDPPVQEGLRESSQSRLRCRRESRGCRRTPPRRGLKLGAAELGKSISAFPLDQRFQPFAEHCRTIQAPHSAKARARYFAHRVSLRCPTYRQNSHANHTWHQHSPQTACFKGSEARSPWVRFPSPAPLSGNARPRTAIRFESRH
jgi:hypothetical protein